MVDLGGILKNLIGPESMARQFFLWSVAASVASTALGPYLESLRQDVNADHPVAILTPADLADMVVRGILTEAQAAGIAKRNGLSSDNFHLLVQDTGEPPSALDLVLLYRRGKLSKDLVIKGIKQGRTRDEWINTMFDLGDVVPSPVDVVNALVKGQLSDGDAHTRYAQLGGDPDWFDLLFNSAGEGPSPDQAAVAARRGIIPWDGTGPGVTSFSQAVRESHFRDKWENVYKALAEYIPPPRTVSAMLGEGSLTVAQAAKLFADSGLPADLTQAYLSSGTTKKLGKQKDLAESEISTLYQENAIGVADAKQMLGLLKYDDADQNFIIQTWDMARVRKFKETAISSVHTQYTGHKISQQQAAVSLDAFGIPATQRNQLLELWGLERQDKVRLLTPAEIKKALGKNLLTLDDAVVRLVDMGYAEDDVSIYLQL